MDSPKEGRMLVASRHFSLALAALLAAPLAAAPQKGKPKGAAKPAAAAEPATLVLRGGRIATLVKERPFAEALAARGEKIVAVGSDAEIEKLIGPATEVIALRGAFAIPGFIDGHAHLLGVGDARLQLDLGSARSFEEIVSMVAAAVSRAAPGEVIRGRGWHQSKWVRPPKGNVNGFPVHEALSAVSPDHPVVLTHASGHAVFVNAKALELAGVTHETPDPDGGEIAKDPDGNPTGLLNENAESLVAGLLATASGGEAADRRRVALATEEALSKGITTFQDAGSSLANVALFKALADEGKLPIRLWVMLREANAKLAEGLAGAKLKNHAGRLTVGGIKKYMDGALGSRGAWLLAPYADLPESSGLNTESPADLAETAALAKEHGLQLCVHAIGDRANRETLDLYEAALGGRKDLRWRVEHAQHLDPADVPRFAKLGVVASMQAVHCTSDAVFVPARLGAKRAEEGAYAWRRLLDAGAVVSNGTDAPVEDLDPIAGFLAFVTRRPRGSAPFVPSQRLSREEALRAMTWAPAYAAFEEGEKGSLAAGKLADVTVLSRDLLAAPEEEIAKAQVLYTIVGGKVAYRKAR